MPGAAGAVSPPAGHDACERAAQMPLALYQRAVEKRDDLLLSTLANYLRATGATAPRIVITTSDGRDLEYPLPAPRTADTG